MISNKVKRNIWLTLTIMSGLCVPDRAARVINGSMEWWKPFSAAIIACLCYRFYSAYRKQVKRGNLFGKIKVF